MSIYMYSIAILKLEVEWDEVTIVYDVVSSTFVGMICFKAARVVLYSPWSRAINGICMARRNVI